jgi:hypothetical protein
MGAQNFRSIKNKKKKKSSVLISILFFLSNREDNRNSNTSKTRAIPQEQKKFQIERRIAL